MGLWNDELSRMDRSQSTEDDLLCPRCGENAYHDEILDKIVCKHCGGAFDKDTRELKYSFDIRDNEEAGTLEKKLKECMCKTCGTTVVTHEHTTPTHCAFCGAKELQSHDLTRQFRPDSYIPFKVTRDEAVRKFKEFAAAMKDVPKSFATEATLSKVTGVYVPFWLIDTDNHLSIRANATKISGEDAGQRLAIEVEHDYKLTGIPFDGGRGINDALMEAIEPYDYKDLKPYDPICLKGYLAERFDIKPLDMTERIILRLYTYSNQAPSNFCKGYKDISVVNNYSSVNDIRQRYVLLPMWFLTYEYEGVRYNFAVNAQTGEVDGEMPIAKEKSERKKLAVKLMLIAPFVLLFLWGVYMVLFHNDEVYSAFDFFNKFGIFLVFLILAPFFLSKAGMRPGGAEAERDFRRGIRDSVSSGIDSLPGVAEKMIADAGTHFERQMDSAPDVGAYLETNGIEPHINVLHPANKMYVE